MGGQGPGHKSVRAIEARLINIRKARAARRRAPLPWRSEMESRIIEQLVYQWWVTTSGEWLVTSGEERRQRGVARRDVEANLDATDPPGSPSRGPGRPHFARAKGLASKRLAPTIPQARPIPHARLTGDVGGPICFGLGGPSCAKATAGKPTTAGRPWAKYKVARLLGVSHTWVNKLVKRFEANPDRMRRRMAAFAPTSLEKLERAREETRRQRERGWLRGPIRTRRVKLTLWGKKRAVTLPTRSEKRRRESAAKGRPESPLYVAHQELPMWARGLMLPGGIAVTGSDMSDMGKRAVPFAFRRRR